jgi:shikimate dehydrogenase
LDSLDESAERVGAVNTIANREGKLVGYNTDVAGFARALRDDAQFDAKSKHVAIMGAGGAARAVALVAVEAGASYVMLSGRSPRRMDKLVADFRKIEGIGTTITWTHWGDGVFMTFFPKADLIVNATPVGTAGSPTNGSSPIDAQWLPKKGLAFDVVYNPPETAFLQMAKDRGLGTASGLGMLAYQAAESFRLWTGKDADVNMMLAAGRNALGAEA